MSDNTLASKLASTGNAMLDDINQGIYTVVNALAPIAEAALPEVATAISIGTKIVQGVIQLEPTAIELYKRIIAGTNPPTTEEMLGYAAEYETAYNKLNADITAKLATAK